MSKNSISNHGNISSVYGQDLPLGLSMAMAQNPMAISYFGSLTSMQKQQVIAGSRNIRSKSEMKQYVDSLAHNELPMEFGGFN